MKSKFSGISIVLLTFILSISFSLTAYSKTTVPPVFKAKYPKETILSLKSADLDRDRKSETVILSKQGNLFLVNEKAVTKVATKIFSFDYGDYNPRLYIFNPTKGEYHVITTFSYQPSNTQATVYKMKNNKLVKVLNTMGDISIRIGKTSITQNWKKYNNPSVGGWKSAATVYTWDNKKQKYTSSTK